jgi:hypothetical protein
MPYALCLYAGEVVGGVVLAGLSGLDRDLEVYAVL